MLQRMINDLHGLDPRTKLTLGLAAIVAVFIAHSSKTLIAEGLILLFLILLMGLRREWIHSFRPVLPLVGLIFVISLISFGAWIALLLSLRLYILLTVSFVFFRSISPEDIGRGLGEMGIPYGVVFIFMTAIRYVPLIGLKIRNIIDAQQSRGIDLRPKIRNTLNFMALLMPLLVQAFLLSDELAMAMEARGFGRKGRSPRKAYRLTILDWGLIALCPTFLLVFYWWERY